MAVIRKSNFAFKGRLGLNPATIVLGVNILKGLPASVRNPRTSAQMDNRDRFQTLKMKIFFTIYKIFTIFAPLFIVS